MTRGRVAFALELLLASAGVLLVEKCAVDLWAGHTFQSQGSSGFVPSSFLAKGALSAEPVNAALTPVIGRLEVPSLAISVLVVEGDGRDDLRLGAGHLSGTPFPGSQGNSVIAGHRDTVFYPIRKIRPGDRLDFAAKDSLYHYRVRNTRIVDPTDLTPLHNDKSRRELTLITCYPFTFVGPAPQRFIVTADLI